ncbi:MAG: hypothetical protein AAFQ98_03675, partial [Bacteroidota bacterium]
MDKDLQDFLETVVNTGGLLGSIILSIYFVARFNYKVKKAIADNGGDPYARRSRSRFLEYGVILLCLGLGIASLAFLSSLGISRIPKERKPRSSSLMPKLERKASEAI